MHEFAAAGVNGLWGQFQQQGDLFD